MKRPPKTLPPQVVCGQFAIVGGDFCRCSLPLPRGHAGACSGNGHTWKW